MDSLQDHFFYEGKRVEVGHPVQIRPSAPRKRDGFEATIKGIRFSEGVLTGIDVIDPHTGALRTLHPHRVRIYLRGVERKKETMQGKKGK